MLTGAFSRRCNLSWCWKRGTVRDKQRQTACLEPLAIALIDWDRCKGVLRDVLQIEADTRLIEAQRVCQIHTTDISWGYRGCCGWTERQCFWQIGFLQGLFGWMASLLLRKLDFLAYVFLFKKNNNWKRKCTDRASGERHSGKGPCTSDLLFSALHQRWAITSI